MSMQYIRDRYNVPAKRFGRVVYSGNKKDEPGVITGTRGTYLLIRLDSQTVSLPYHPTFALRYLDEVAA